MANRSYVASVDRPVSGSGLRSVFAMDVPLVKFLSRSGVSYDVTTDSSLDATPAQLVGQPTVLIGGHSEYWTRRMYEAAVQARDAGTNFGFLGANAIYWQGRIERDPGGRASALTVYRLAALDLPARADPAKTTVQWRQPPLLRDPAALAGVGMSVVGARGPYVVNTAPAWLFAGTNLRKGAVLPLAIGNEADAQQPPNGHSPANLQVVFRGGGPGAGQDQGVPDHRRILRCAQRRRGVRGRDDLLGLQPRLQLPDGSHPPAPRAWPSSGSPSTWSPPSRSPAPAASTPAWAPRTCPLSSLPGRCPWGAVVRAVRASRRGGLPALGRGHCWFPAVSIGSGRSEEGDAHATARS